MKEESRKKTDKAEEKMQFNNKRLPDGCTLSPDFNFKECCNEHDIDYMTKRVSRRESDKKLRQCIAKKGVGFYNYRVLPWVYWAGVRVFGGRYYRNEGGSKCKICDFFRKKLPFFN